MARDFVDTNPDYIDFGNSSTIMDATSVNISGWTYIDNVTQDHTFINWFDPADSSGLELKVDNSDSSSGRTDTWRALVKDTGGTQVIQSIQSDSAVANQWQHVFLSLEAASATGGQIWVDGAEGTGGTSPFDISGVSDFGLDSTVGIRLGENNNGGAELDGKLAEVGIWTGRILTDAEILILSKGYSPLFIPNGLEFYAPLIGRNSPEPELVGGLSGTLTGTPTVYVHPSMIYPTPKQIANFGEARVVQNKAGLFL